MELLLIAAVIALIAYALEHNHRKHPAPRLNGSTTPFTHHDAASPLATRRVHHS